MTIGLGANCGDPCETCTPCEPCPCDSGAQVQMTMAGVVDGGCTGCAVFNTSFVLNYSPTSPLSFTPHGINDGGEGCTDFSCAECDTILHRRCYFELANQPYNCDGSTPGGLFTLRCAIYMNVDKTKTVVSAAVVISPGPGAGVFSSTLTGCVVFDGPCDNSLDVDVPLTACDTLNDACVVPATVNIAVI